MFPYIAFSLGTAGTVLAAEGVRHRLERWRTRHEAMETMVEQMSADMEVMTAAFAVHTAAFEAMQQMADLHMSGRWSS